MPWGYPYATSPDPAAFFHLDLHGSIARDEAAADSDVELIADFDRAKP
jgi:predicted nucleotidyltransferase